MQDEYGIDGHLLIAFNPFKPELSIKIKFFSIFVFNLTKLLPLDT